MSSQHLATLDDASLLGWTELDTLVMGDPQEPVRQARQKVKTAIQSWMESHGCFDPLVKRKTLADFTLFRTYTIPIPRVEFGDLHRLHCHQLRTNDGYYHRASTFVPGTTLPTCIVGIIDALQVATGREWVRVVIEEYPSAAYTKNRCDLIPPVWRKSGIHAIVAVAILTHRPDRSVFVWPLSCKDQPIQRTVGEVCPTTTKLPTRMGEALVFDLDDLRKYKVGCIQTRLRSGRGFVYHRRCTVLYVFLSVAEGRLMWTRDTHSVTLQDYCGR